MSLYQEVTRKPWNSVGLPDGIDPKPTFNVSNEKLALVVFVIIASVLFSLLTVSYFIRMWFGGGDWLPVALPNMLWVNTAALIAASLSMHMAVISARNVASEVHHKRKTHWFLIAGIATFAFILGQLTVWQQLTAEGYFLQSNPANAFFYLLTGVHILHLLGGLWVWSRALIRQVRKDTSHDIRKSIELCAWYWHFLLIVWFGLFYLVATN
jgi:cytochrome c oxidase subunit 3